jgi:hypothetical protein
MVNHLLKTQVDKVEMKDIIQKYRLVFLLLGISSGIATIIVAILHRGNLALLLLIFTFILAIISYMYKEY